MHVSYMKVLFCFDRFHILWFTVNCCGLCGMRIKKRIVTCLCNVTCVDYKQDRQCTYNLTSRRIRVTISGKYNKYSIFVCVCVCKRACVFIQQATCMRHIVTPLAPPRFSTLPHKQDNFQKVTERKMRGSIFSTTSV